MKIITLPNGNLEMALGDELSRFSEEFGLMDIGRNATESLFIEEWLSPLGYYEIGPEEVGALTSAPLIRKGDDVWGYMDYQILSFLEQLKSGKSVIWQKG